MSSLNHVSFKSLCLVLDLVDVGSLKADLPTSLVPSTSKNYLGPRLGLEKVPGSLHALMVGIHVMY